MERREGEAWVARVKDEERHRWAALQVGCSERRTLGYIGFVLRMMGKERAPLWRRNSACIESCFFHLRH